MSRGGMSFGRDLDVKDQLGQGGAAGIFRDWRGGAEEGHSPALAVGIKV